MKAIEAMSNLIARRVWGRAFAGCYAGLTPMMLVGWVARSGALIADRFQIRHIIRKAMTSPRLGATVAVTLIVGCATTGSITEPAIDAVSRPKFLSQLDAVDAIQIEELTLSSRKDISRFIQICRNARWAPFISTMPAKVDTIKFISNGIETHRLLYAGGWLLDTSGDGIEHFGTIHAEDGKWIDDNVDTQLMLLRNAL